MKKTHGRDQGDGLTGHPQFFCSYLHGRYLLNDFHIGDSLITFSTIHFKKLQADSESLAPTYVYSIKNRPIKYKCPGTALNQVMTNFIFCEISRIFKLYARRD